MDKGEFLKKLEATFKVEAEEHLKCLSSGLLELEKKLTDKKKTAVVETVFRAAHSLKGAARALDLLDIEAICQSLESVFSALKRKKMSVSRQRLDTLHDAVDFVSDIVQSPQKGQTAGDTSRIKQQLARLETSESESGFHPEKDVRRLHGSTR